MSAAILENTADPPTQAAAICPICGSAAAAVYAATEMMFGRGELFHYFHCEGCGSLRLTDPPADWSVHYPADAYYSLAAPTPPAPRGWARRWLARRRNYAQIFRRGGIFGAIARRRPNSGLYWAAELLADAKPNRDVRILDVGCGGGQMLSELAGCGLRSLTGADPYLPGPIRGPGPIVIHAADAQMLIGSQFDVIQLHHVLEHISDQLKMLQTIKALLAPAGYCRIEIPVVGKLWKEYGVQWVELDAPRHQVLHTRASLTMLAQRAGLEVYRVMDKTIAFSIWGSEMYRRGLTLFDAAANRYRDPKSVFTAEQMAQFDQKAMALNSENGDGGRTAFYLRHARPGEMAA